MRKNSSLRKILILVALLALPGFLYYLLQEKGKNRYKPLDIFGPKKVASTFHKKRGKLIPDTIYHQIRDFQLKDQNGNLQGLPTDSGKIAIVNFFYSRCNTVCKQMNESLSKIVAEYSTNPKIHFYSISVDPEYDNVATLKTYAASFKADAKKWSFLTADKKLVFDLAKKDFMLNALAGDGDSNLVHSSMVVIVDPKKRIRGYYDAVRKEEMEKLSDELKVLITEELREVTSLKPIK
jgi:protein SCO1